MKGPERVIQFRVTCESITVREKIPWVVFLFKLCVVHEQFTVEGGDLTVETLVFRCKNKWSCKGSCFGQWIISALSM